MLFHKDLELGVSHLREERTLTYFDSRVLRKILGPNRDGVTKDKRKLLNEKLRDFYQHHILFG